MQSSIHWWGSGHATPSTAPWHTEYLKLKEFKKMAEAGEGHFDLPLHLPSSLKAGDNCPT